MKDTLNAELLAAEARGRKHIPFAVFAVVLIHVVLFVILLVAAGCRAKARAKLKAVEPAQAILVTNTPAAAISEPIVATEPVVEAEDVQATATAAPVTRPTAVQLEVPRVRQQNPTPAAVPERVRAQPEPAKVKFYEVKPGDSLAVIAKRHGTTVKAIKQDNNLKADFLKVGQKLRLRAPSTDLAMR